MLAAGCGRDPRWIAWAAVAAGVATAVPFWIGRYLPFLDMPQHLALATVIRHHADPAWGFGPYFEVQWGELTPYWLTYAVVHLLAQAMPVETAARVFLSLYALAFPWAGIALGRAFGQPGWIGLLAAPLALNTNLYYGFLNYGAGVVLLLFAVAAFQRQLDEPRSRALGLGVLAIALFFAHVQALALFLVCALVQALAQPAAWRRALRAGLSLVPAVAGLLAPWAYWTFIEPQGSERQFASIEGDPTPRFESLATNLRELPASVAGAFQDGSDGLLLAAWSVLAAVGLLHGWGKTGPSRARLVPALLAATALAGYFLAPMSIKGQWNINPRFALPASLLVLPALRFGSPRRAGAAALALSLATAANAAWHHAAFDREVGPFEAALESLPRGQRVLALMYDPRGRVLEKWPYLHFGQYAMVRRGGAAGGSFAASAPMPVRYRDVKAFPHPGPWRPGDFDPLVHGSCYDYVLVRGTPPGRPPADVPGGLLEPVLTAGPWRLYRSAGMAAADAGGAARREDAPPPPLTPGRGGGS